MAILPGNLQFLMATKKLSENSALLLFYLVNKPVKTLYEKIKQKNFLEKEHLLVQCMKAML